MSAFFRHLFDNEPPTDPDDTEQVKPVFPLADMGKVVMLVAPDGSTHVVRRGTLVYRVMKSHGYKEQGA